MATREAELEAAEQRLVGEADKTGPLGRLFNLLKAKPPRLPTDADEDEEAADEAPPAPSEEDAVKEQAPDQAAPPPSPAAGGDEEEGDDDEDDEDEDEDDEAGAPPAAPPGAAPDEDEDEDDEEEGGGDAALRKQVLKRSHENPDFFKSLLEGDDAEEVVRLIDASDVLAFVVQTFSEQLLAAQGEATALRKSFTRRLTALEKSQEVTLLALEKSLEQQAQLLKSQGEQEALLKSLGDAPLGTPTGLRQLRPSKRDAPPATTDHTVPQGAGRAYDKGRLSQALMKAQMAGDMGTDRAGNLMLMLDTEGGPGRVATYLETHHPDLYTQAVG